MIVKCFSILLTIIVSVVGQQQNSSYGQPIYSNIGTTGITITGFGTGPAAEVTSSSPSDDGRIVSNSILEPLDLDDEPNTPIASTLTGGYGTGNGNANDQSPQFNKFQQPLEQSNTGFIPSGPVPQRPTANGSYNNGQNSNSNGANVSTGLTGGSNHNSNFESNSQQGPNTIRYVSVHIPVPEPVIPSRARVAQPTQKPDRHYQIVFIKAPSMSQELQQEIQVPPPVETKTIVYLLLKNPDRNTPVKISQRPTRRPPPPEVYFIRYKNGDKLSRGQNNVDVNGINNSGNSQHQERNNNFNNNNHGNLNYKNEVAVRPEGNRGTPQPQRVPQGGYGGGSQHEIAASDFSSHESFDANEFSLSSFDEQHHQHQSVHSEISYSAKQR